MEDNKLDNYLAIAERQGMQDIIKFAENQMKTTRGAPFTVGIIGNNFIIIPLLSELIEKTELEGILASRSFFMEILEGDETACFRLDEQENKKISFLEMQDDLEKTVSLDSEEELPVLHLRMTVADWKIKGVRLLAIGSAEEFRDIQWQEAAFLMDECCMVLSASRLLAIEERSFIREGEVPVNTYILTGMQQIMEEEWRNDVLRQLISFIGGNGENVIRADDRESMQILRSSWENKCRDTDAIEKKRRETLEQSICRRIEHNLEGMKSAYQSDGKKIQDMTDHLAKAYSVLPSHKEQTVRYIRMYYLEEMKSQLQSELIGFNSKLRQDIKTGIDEENDIKQLQNALAGYIMGEWETFIREALKKRMDDTALRIDAEIEDYIGRNVEKLLRQFLSGEEYSNLENLLKGRLEKNNISTQSGNIEMDGSGVLFNSGKKSSFSELLPKCVMAAGGIALLCSSFIPGVLMVFMGYQMNLGAKDAAKDKLLQEGREISDKCLKEIQDKMQQAFADMEKDTAELVSDCYDTVLERLFAILEDFKESGSGMKEKLAQIETEIQQLR